MKLSARDLRYVAIFALLSTIITSGAAYRLLSPAPTEQFFAMWVLGAGGLVQDYYPNNNPTLAVGEPLNWTIGVYNHMGDLEYVVVRVKLLNSTLNSPDELSGTPSPVPTILEFRRVLVDNDTWSIPFAWQILNLTRERRSLSMNGLLVNQNVLRGTLGSATSGINYRLVFELWFYDNANQTLSFSSNPGGVGHSVWTQIWFNATMT